MITLRSKREIELLKKAGSVVALVHKAMQSAIKEGVSLNTLDSIAEKIIRENGCTPSFKGYGGFPKSICASVNDTLIHGIPNNYCLKNGDIISIDVGACYKGYHGDSAWTYKVGTISEELERLMQVTEKALYLGLAEIKPGKRIGDIANAIEQYVYQNNFTIPTDYTGHGVGTSLHEDPMVPNLGKPNTLEILKKGMVFAVEPMVFVGSNKTYVDKDKWAVKSVDKSYSAHYEHTVVVTEEGFEILTKL